MVRKNMDIECLRAVAIILTLVLHLQTLLPYPSGLLQFITAHAELSVGVDLFFVISGFVITQSLLHSERRGISRRRDKIFSFWLKRAFRLLPVSLLWLVILACYFAAIGELMPFIKPILAAALNIMNWYSPYCVANPHDASVCAYYPHGHYWSLSLEEQFYLLYPFLFFFVPRRVLPYLVIAVITVQFFWNRPIWGYAWFFRTDALCWGVLLGLMAHSVKYRALAPTFWSSKWLSISTGLLLVLVLVLVGGAFTGFGGDSHVFGVALVALVAAVLVWLASYDNNYFSVSGWCRHVLGYVGARSYSLYVCHLIIFTILSQQVNVSLLEQLEWSPRQIKALFILLGVGATLLASELSYRYLETPTRNLGRTLARRWDVADKARRHEALGVNSVLSER